MNKKQWVTAKNSQAMLACLVTCGKVSDRKLRLYACACARQVWYEYPDGRCQRAVEVAEQYADAGASSGMLLFAYEGALKATREAQPGSEREQLAVLASLVASDPGLAASYAATEIGRAFSLLRLAKRAQADLLRCIFGNPFRPLLPLARSGGALDQLARATYSERLMPSGHLDPARLAVLADALEEAGAPEEMSSHLLAPGPHVRGCHVLDLLLSRG